MAIAGTPRGAQLLAGHKQLGDDPVRAPIPTLFASEQTDF